MYLTLKMKGVNIPHVASAIQSIIGYKIARMLITIQNILIQNLKYFIHQTQQMKSISASSSLLPHLQLMKFNV